MKTAVPGTRGGFFRAMSARKRSRGNDPAWRIWFSIVRPVFQVLMMMNTIVAIISVTQPPLAILIAFAARNAMSMTRNAVGNTISAHTGHSQRRLATTVYRMLVI